MTTDNPGPEQLAYTLEEARWVWEETARVMALHRELADMYRNNSRDTRTIRTIWERIEEGEAPLRAIGVSL
jgi:hypothetical protein